MTKDFVPKDFAVPAGIETEHLRLRMLTVNDVVRDFDAVISSKPQLIELLPTWGGWPEGLTLEQNLIDLGWHQKEFQRRRSFAYTVVAPDESRVIGCVYIYPASRGTYDAEVHYWARESALGDPDDVRLDQAVRRWIERDWPFERVAYPGRSIDWASWQALA